LQKKNKRKKQNFETLNAQPIQTFSTPHYTEKTERPLHCQMLAHNLLRGHRKKGLDAEGITPELLRLKYYDYCS
jgi:hypothetical protein